MKLVVVVTGALALFGATRPAVAGPAAWCGDAKFDANGEDLRRLSSDRAEDAVHAIVTVLCSSNPDIEPHRADVEAARQAWGKKLFMTDADWADTPVWVKGHHEGKSDFSAKSLKDFTPIDQYKAIVDGFQGVNGSSGEIDPLYLADAFGAQFSQSGRLALLVRYCFKGENVAHVQDDATKMAICQGDIDAFDPAKVSEELRADSQHTGEIKMMLRWRAVMEYPELLAKWNDAKTKLIKADDEYKKMFDITAKARDEWQKTVGTNSKLLDLTLQMDSGSVFHSRKLLDGCEDTTQAALADAIATLPAKAFADMHDVRDDPFKGFGSKAGPLLVSNPKINLAVIAYVLCNYDRPSGAFLTSFVQNVPGQRGPRNASMGALMKADFKFDDLNAGKLHFPSFGARPYSFSGGAVSTAGGVVKSVKPGKDGEIVVALEKTTMKQNDCVKEHNGPHIESILASGTVQYELICDKWAVVEHDTTWTDFKISKDYEKVLKPGVVFTSTYTENQRAAKREKGRGADADVLAIWPNKSAPLPSWVLGAKVK